MTITQCAVHAHYLRNFAKTALDLHGSPRAASCLKVSAIASAPFALYGMATAEKGVPGKVAFIANLGWLLDSLGTVSSALGSSSVTMGFGAGALSCGLLIAYCKYQHANQIALDPARKAEALSYRIQVLATLVSTIGAAVLITSSSAVLPLGIFACSHLISLSCALYDNWADKRLTAGAVGLVVLPALLIGYVKGEK